MNIDEINKAISKLNPYNAGDRELLRTYLIHRRYLEAVEEIKVSDDFGDLPEILKRQSGV